MTNKELLEKIAEAINDSTESIKVVIPTDNYWNDADKYTETIIEIINPVYLSSILQQLADSL